MPRQNKPSSPSGVTQAIACQLDCLTALLGDSVEALTEARAYLDRGELNAAIGTILGLKEDLADAGALHQSIQVLHRRR